MIKTRINNNHSFTIHKEGQNYLINEFIYQCDIQKIDNNIFILHLNNQSYTASIVRNEKHLIITINHNEYHVDIQDENDLILEKLGINTKSVKRHEQLKAPMPGLIVDVRVKKGDEVRSGQPLIVLKAMKMENVIKSPHDGVISEIFVIKDQKIEKDAVMLQF